MSADPTPVSSLRLRITPSGRVALDDDPGAATPLAPAALQRIRTAFAKGAGHGLLHLGGAELSTALPETLCLGRDLGRCFLTRLRNEPELEALREKVSVAAPESELAELLDARPPIDGDDALTPDALAARWNEMLGAFREAIARHDGTVQSWLATLDPVWHTVGRVHLHLVENKQNPAVPFAFMATYTARVSASAAVQHLPLGRALQEYAGANNRAALLSLLTPVQRASERSAVFRAMVESSELYRPQAWSPSQALRFLREIPALQEAGLIVRVPDWWHPKHPARPQVQVTVGESVPSVLNASALLSFDVALSLDGETLTAEEWRAIQASADGLVSLRGRWIEVDRDKLDALLKHWKSAQRAARDGIGFHEAMRLLAGVPMEAAGGEAVDDAGGWTRVTAGAELSSLLERLRDPTALATLDPGKDLRATLRPYQRDGVKWLWLLSSLGLGGCLADDMGLGKTLQVLTLLLLRKRLRTREKHTPSLLVAPASLLANWHAEAARFTPTLKLVIAHPSAMSSSELAGLTGDSKSIEHSDLVVTSYGAVARSPWITERRWDLVVLDEAQAIKNPGAQQSRAVKSLQGSARIALTGTPVENRAGDLWSLFDFLAPGMLGSASAFGRAAKRMTDAGHWEPLRRLVRPYVLRRLKTDKRVIADLPDKTELNAWCPLTAVQAGLYQRVVEDLAAQLKGADGIERRGVILTALMAFKQICNHPSQRLGDNHWNPTDSGKFARLAELCEPIAARQEKALVFTQFREMTEPLRAFLAGVFGRDGLVLHGSTAVKERQRRVDVFQRDESVPFFVLSLKAGGTGLNLTAASHVIHFDRWWNPAVENQATDRAFRIGQKRNVLVHRFVCRGTVEERIDALLERKRSLSDALLASDGEEVRLTEMSNDEVLTMVSLDLDAAMNEA